MNKSPTFKRITNDDIFLSIQDIHQKLDKVEVCYSLTEQKLQTHQERIKQIETMGKLAIGGIITTATGLILFIFEMVK